MLMLNQLQVEGKYGFYDQGICSYILFKSLGVKEWLFKLYFFKSILINFTVPAPDNLLSDKNNIYAHTVIHPRNYDTKYLINVYADKFELRYWDWNTVLMLSHEFCHVYFYEEVESDKVRLFHWLLDYLRREGYEVYYPMKRLDVFVPAQTIMVYDIPRIYKRFYEILQECNWSRNEDKAKQLIQQH